MSSRTKALIAIVLAALLWSTAGLSKIVVRELDPYVAAFLRFFVASIVILPFFLKEKRNHKKILRDLVPLSLLSMGNILFYYLGLSYSTANTATIIYAGGPMLTAVIAHYLIGERMNRYKFIGIFTGLIGVIIIALLPDAGGISVSGSLIGNFFFMTAVIIWSFYTIGSHRAIAKKGYSPLTVAGLSIFVTCIGFGIISIFTFEPKFLTTIIQPSTVFLVLHLGIFVTVATYILFQWVVKHSSATTASLNNYISPVFAIMINSVVLKEPITPIFLLGGMLVFIGVIVLGTSGLLRKTKGVVTL